jgi:uncharacterized protein (TIGR03435 family)
LTIVFVLIALGGALSGSVLNAQQPQPVKSLHFEVATIKPGVARPGFDYSTSGGAPGGQFQMMNVPLKQWVKTGLSVRDYALRAPAWLDTARFDLNARVPADAPTDRNATPEMIRSLLIERFGLKWHEESQIVSGYELVTDKKVLVQPSSAFFAFLGRRGASGSGPTLINGTNMSMSELAGALGQALGRPVVDATHLSGGFDIKLRWRPTDDAELASQRQYGKQYGIDVDNLPASVSTAVREQLGLRLQPAKVPSKVIVIDQNKSQPTAN